MKPEIFVGMALKAWDIQIARVNRFLDSLDNDALEREVAPGKNRISYLLGHLIAVNDRMIELFGAGPRAYAHFEEVFVTQPDRSGTPGPNGTTLRQHWKDHNQQLTTLFRKMTALEWFDKHAAMSDDDLVREPTRNKLSVLINRTNHVAYHLGQFALVKPGFE